MKRIILFLILSSSIASCKNSSSPSNTELIQFVVNNDQPSTAFNLEKDAALSIGFTLDKPLVQILKELAPDVSEETLLKKGNFQFSFLVDGQLIYTENLNIGAGTLTDKTTRLSYTVPLVTPERIDYWGWYMWLRFMKLHGGQDALNEGSHTLSIQLKTYIDNDTLYVGPLLAEGTINITVPRKQIDERLVPVQQIQPNSGWSISKDAFDSTKIEALNRKIAEGRFEDINSIVVVKNGNLLIEEYFNGENRESLHNPRSVGKTIASTVLGIAIEEKHIKNESQQLKDFYDLKKFKNYSPEKDKVTLKALLTMTAGFTGDDLDTNNPGHEDYMYPTNDWVKFALDQAMDTTKIMGKDHAYFTPGVVVLGDIIHKSVPEGLVSYADKKLFSPLGINNYKWQYTPQNVGNTAGGIQLRAIDFAKYGQLYKNKGQWKGKQILTEKWVEKSLAKQVSQAFSQIKDGYYGYLFWNKTYTVNGKEYEVSFCSGNGGNKIFVFKDIPFVVVITASAYNSPTAHPNADKIMTDYVLPAVLD